jgi:arylsulfatase A-like enzyme
MRPNRSLVAALLAAVVAIATASCGDHGGGASAPGAARPKPTGPTLILVSIDTLRADAVTGFGAPPEQTPNLLEFGNESVRFDTAISASHITAPSHATMFTGYSPFVHGTLFQRPSAWRIPKTIKTIAEILHEAGYFTAAFADGGQVHAEVGFDRGFDLFTSEASGIPAKIPAIEKYIRGCDGKPAFLFIHTYRPHLPYRPVPRHLQKLLNNYSGIYAEGVRMSSKMTPAEAMVPSKAQARVLSALDPARAKHQTDRDFLHKVYNSGVTGADDEMGALFSMLKRTGIYDSAMIVVTSDHGENLFETGTPGHHDVFDACTRVPLMIPFPGAQHAGLRIAQTFPAVDLVPSLLEFLAVPHKVSFEGVSIAKDFPPKAFSEHTAYSAWFTGESEGRFPRGVAARVRDGKRIEVRVDKLPEWIEKFGKIQFFDLSKDKAEKTNLAGLCKTHPQSERERFLL